MKKLLTILRDRLLENKSSVLVTVVASSGSTPRGSGARMIVGEEGRLSGTIGGGAVEWKSTEIAVEVLREKSSQTRKFNLSKADTANLGMICGGAVSVYFEYVDSSRKDILELCENALELMQKGTDAWLITETTENSPGAMCLYVKGENVPNVPSELLGMIVKPTLSVEVQGRSFYCEQIVAAGRVFVFGGGHVAQELVPVLTHVGFRCVVLDDREQFASPEVFPTAEETILVDFMRISEYITVTENDYICIMTRGHEHDTTVQRYALRTPANYIGVMGSRGKMASIAALLKSEGFLNEDIARIITPIGFNIKAVTPAELAISISAELIMHRAERNGL